MARHRAATSSIEAGDTSQYSTVRVRICPTGRVRPEVQGVISITSPAEACSMSSYSRALYDVSCPPPGLLHRPRHTPALLLLVEVQSNGRWNRNRALSRIAVAAPGPAHPTPDTRNTNRSPPPAPILHAVHLAPDRTDRWLWAWMAVPNMRP